MKEIRDMDRDGGTSSPRNFFKIEVLIGNEISRPAFRGQVSVLKNLICLGLTEGTPVDPFQLCSEEGLSQAF